MLLERFWHLASFLCTDLSFLANLYSSRNLHLTAEHEMDVAFESIKHEVAWKTLNVRHLIEVSPNTVDLAREIRITIIAVALCFSGVQLARLWSNRSHTSR